MQNTHGYSAALLAIALCGTPLLSQQDPAAPPPASPATAAAASIPNPSQETSPGVRIVRLSEVVGVAQLDRKNDHGFENAFANLPITQGARLRTDEGAAEVEFEDNSSLRLTPHSSVEFPVLSLGRDGVRTSTVHVLQGTVYVSLTKSKGSSFNVTFGKQALTLAPAAHIELAVSPAQSRLDVLDGTVQATSGANTTTVGHKKGLLFDAAGSGAPTLVSKSEPGPFADWDKRSADYHSHYAVSSNYASTPYAYGTADMNYYGSFQNVGQCGSMWRPYLASANWSPYSNGTWAWYSGAGYSWVSPYPWGWTPYHSGSWDYCSTGGGWGWRPNSQWNGLQNVPTAAVKPGTIPGGSRGLRPPHVPQPLGPTLVPVHEAPLVRSTLTAQDTFVFQKDSAGLGVPRGTFGKLGGISAGVAHNGTVERTVFFPSASGNQGAQGVQGSRNANQHGNQPGPNHTAPSRTSTAMTGNAIASSRSMATSNASSSAGHSSSSAGFSGGYSGGGMSAGAMSGGGARGSMSSGGSGGGSSGGHH